MSLIKAKARNYQGGASALRALLAADRFRLGAGTARVATNLLAHGGISDEGAGCWIGDDLPPLGAPSVTLGKARGTLGPHSFGFLDNQRGIAAYAAPLVQRPRRGSAAIVCGRRDELPDMAPLAIARGLGISWIISTGEGLPDEVLAFLATDEATRVILLAAGAQVNPAALVALGAKPAVVLGGQPLVRAAARRSGGIAVDDLEAWFAHGALLEAGVSRPRRPVAVVLGGGAAILQQAAASFGLALSVHALDDEQAEQFAATPQIVPDAVFQSVDASPIDLLLVAGTGPLPHSALPSVTLDLGHAERVRAVLGAIAARQRVAEPALPRIEGLRDQAMAIIAAAGSELADHDTKRVLKAYGAKVSRQAPASSATRAAQLATQIGYPVDVVAGASPLGARNLGRSPRESERRAPSAAEVRRAAALFLDEASFVLIREAFPDRPRARLRVVREKSVGAVIEVEGSSKEQALLPLETVDAMALARAASAPPLSDDPGQLMDLITRIAAAAHECELALEVELYVGRDPAVVSATASRS